MRKKFEEGIILISTVLFLFIFSLLLLSELNTLILYYQVLGHNSKKQQLFAFLEEEAGHLMAQNTLASCIVTPMDPNTILLELKNKKGCLIKKKGKRFTYLKENLGLFPCLPFRLGDQYYGSQQFRLTLFSPKGHYFLQYRYAKKGPKAFCEGGSFRELEYEFMSWRQINQPRLK